MRRPFLFAWLGWLLRRWGRCCFRRLAHLLDFRGGLEIEHLDLEDEVRIGRDRPCPRRAIAERGRQAEAIDTTLGHALQPFGEARYHAIDGERSLRVLVEHRAVGREIA